MVFNFSLILMFLSLYREENNHAEHDTDEFGSDQCFGRKSGKWTEKMQNNSAVTESWQLEDSVGSMDLHHIDESLPVKNSLTKSKVRTSDSHFTKKPGKKDNRRIRFRSVCVICKSAFSSQSQLSNHLPYYMFMQMMTEVCGHTCADFVRNDF